MQYFVKHLTVNSKHSNVLSPIARGMITVLGLGYLQFGFSHPANRGKFIERQEEFQVNISLEQFQIAKERLS
jgi:hypothetical protein